MRDWAETVLDIEERERNRYLASLPVCDSCGERLDPALEEDAWFLPGVGLWCRECVEACRVRIEDYC